MLRHSNLLASQTADSEPLFTMRLALACPYRHPHNQAADELTDQGKGKSSGENRIA